MSVNISAKEVNELRQKTGSGMMDCKKALVEAGGDFDKAIDILRKKNWPNHKVNDLFTNISRLSIISEQYVSSDVVFVLGDIFFLCVVINHNTPKYKIYNI